MLTLPFVAKIDACAYINVLDSLIGEFLQHSRPGLYQQMAQDDQVALLVGEPCPVSQDVAKLLRP